MPAAAPSGTVPCPGTVLKPCGNPIPALPGTNTVCAKCGATLHIYQRTDKSE